MKAKIAAPAGEAAAKVIYAALTFEVDEIRPLAVSAALFGALWEFFLNQVRVISPELCSSR
jgi:hypothetical protein